MADLKISQLTAATTPLDGTEVLPIVQSSTTVKVANNDLRPKQIQSNATSGVLQIAGPAAASTRVMTTPDANFTAARTDAAQTFTGAQTFSSQPVFNGGTASTALALDASKNVTSITNTGTGNNVLATSPTLTTPNIGAATATSVNAIYQKIATATLAASSTKTLTVSNYGSGKAMQFQIVADVGGNGAGSLNIQIQGLLSNANYYSLVETGKFSYLNIVMGSATIGNAQFTVSITNNLASAGTVTVLGIGDSDFSIAVA